MRKVIVDRDEVFGIPIYGYIPENDSEREELRELGIKPFTGEIWHGKEGVSECIQEDELILSGR